MGILLDAASVVHLTGNSWLFCEELKPVESLLAGFRSRGGRVESNS